MLLPAIVDVDRSAQPASPMFKMYGDRLQKVKIACLTSGNSVGIEFFEFIDPPLQQPASFDYTKGGVFHVALTVSDPEALCNEAVKKGAKRIGQSILPWEALGDDNVALYMQDPWGNAIELVSCGFELLMGNRIG